MESSSGNKPFPGFDHVYDVHEGKRPFVVSLQVSLEQAFALVRAEFVPKAAVSAAWCDGSRRPGDFIWTSFAAPVIVHDRIICLFRENRISGWAAYKVAVSGPAGEPVQGYVGLAVTGRSGPLQPDRKREVEKIGPAGNLIAVYQGLFFDPLSWDGSDIFVPEGTGRILMLDRVVDALKLAGVTGVEFSRADTHETFHR